MLNASESAARFWSQVEKSPDGCWLWQGAMHHNGYGRPAWQGRRTMAHRIAYTLLRGDIPEGKQLDHLCRVRRCVNPNHLEPVTQRENILRGIAPTAVNARRTACTHGHDLTPDNTYTTPDGRRQCRVCIKARLAKHAARR
jgi:hypothetical protein